MSSVDGAEPSRRRRDSSSARFAACGREVVERQITMTSTSGGMPVRE